MGYGVKIWFQYLGKDGYCDVPDQSTDKSDTYNKATSLNYLIMMVGDKTFPVLRKHAYGKYTNRPYYDMSPHKPTNANYEDDRFFGAFDNLGYIFCSEFEGINLDDCDLLDKNEKGLKHFLDLLVDMKNKYGTIIMIYGFG